MDFKLVSDYKPQGDQATAIESLSRGVHDREQHQVLLGVTGSGKTYTMAKVIEAVNRPTLVMAHNKTLAAQLYHEFKSFFPRNAVEYFVSYYDYYQPEAYVPAADLYIEKEATINDELDKLRLSPTRSLFGRRDCLIVASVSCIYGLRSPEAYYGMLLFLEKGQKIKREDITRKLVEILYERTDGEFRRGTYRVRGDVIEIFPTYDDMAYRVELWGDEVESLSQIDPLFGTVKQKYVRLPIYPKTHYVMKPETRASAVQSIREELAWWEAELEKQGRVVEAQRVHQRSMYDLEMIKSAGVVVEQIIRPTGLVDPPVEVRPVKGQIDDLLHEIRGRMERGERVLVTTLTKRMAEDLAEYYSEVGVKCRYMHSEIETLERVKILRDLRKGEFDVLIGINLLREGLDLPEVSLVAILDADKEGFLRSSGSLIQTIGRCARNLNGMAVLYADRMTDSMKKAMDETNRRRAIQQAYNDANGITPQSIVRPLEMTLAGIIDADYADLTGGEVEGVPEFNSQEELDAYIAKLESDMREAAKRFEFEKAAKLRDTIKELRTKEFLFA